MDSRERKRQKEKEKERQRRRLQVKSASVDNSVRGGSKVLLPLFPDLIVRPNDEIQKYAEDVLGNYESTVERMQGHDQRTFLGIMETTPSTPVLATKHNPFGPGFKTAASASDSSATSTTATVGRGVTSRHQVAEPPPPSGFTSVKEKKEKGRHQSKRSKSDHPKSISTPKMEVGGSANATPNPRSGSLAAGGGSAKRDRGSLSSQGGSESAPGTDTSRPTNQLVFHSKKQKKTVRPFKPQGSPTSVSHQGPPSTQPKARLSGGTLFGDLLKLDSNRTSQNPTSGRTTSKSRKAQSHSASHIPAPELQHNPPSSGQKSGTLTSVSSNPHPTTTSVLSQAPHKSKKSSTVPSSSSNNSRDSLLLKKTSSSDSIRPHPTHKLAHTASSGSIDISSLRKLSLPVEVSEDSNSGISVPPAPSGGARKKEKKLKKKLKKEREKAFEGESVKMDTSETKPQTYPVKVKSEPQELTHLLSRPMESSSHVTFTSSHVTQPQTYPVKVKSEPQELSSLTHLVSRPMESSSHVTFSSGHVTQPQTYPVKIKSEPQELPSLTRLVSRPMESSSHVTFTSGHVTHPGRHMTYSQAHTGISEVPEHLKAIKPRPSELKITTSSSAVVAEESVQSMLEELSRPLPSLVTPISTPKKNKPFVFPRRQARRDPPSLTRSLLAKPPTTVSSQVASTKQKHPERVSSAILCPSSDEESDSENKMALETAMSTLESSLELTAKSTLPPPSSSPPPVVCIPSCSSSDSSDSSEESGSESSTSSDSEEEPMENVTPTLEKLNKELLVPIGDTITPLKKTPPRFSSGSVSTQPFLGSEGYLQVAELAPLMGESENESSSDSEDSGSESDSESSDSEDQSSEEEDLTKAIGTAQRKSSTHPTSNSSEDLPTFGQENSSWMDDFFRVDMGESDPMGLQGARQSGLQFSEQTPMEIIQNTTEPFGFDTSTQPFGIQYLETKPQLQPLEMMNTESVAAVSEMEPESKTSGQEAESLKVEHGHERRDRKRKHEENEAIANSIARKVPKLTIKMNPETLQVSPTPPAPDNTRSPLFSVSESESSESSSSSDEEDDSAFETPTQAESHQKASTVKEEIPPSVKLESGRNETLAQQQEEGSSRGGGSDALVVRVPLTLVTVGRDQQKPKAKVEPYNVTAPTKGRRATSDSTEREEPPHLSRRISRDHNDRDMYGRHREELDHHHPQYSRDYHRDDRGRPHRDGGRSWEPPSRDRRLHSGSDERGGGRHPRWEREREREHYHRDRDRGDEYWSDYSHYERREYEEGRRQRPYHPERGSGAEYYLKEARRRKHGADQTRTPGVDKAKAYMESVTYFMKHGDALEHSWESGASKNPFRMYLDTINMIKCCQKMAGDCKPLVGLCLRCLSVLSWRLYVLKQPTASQIQKELQDFFIPPKGTQKSPYPISFSPLPSPASVSSTASTSSSHGGTSSLPDPTPSSSTVPVPRSVFNKATEHLTISTYITQSFELWKQSEMLTEQCRDFFTNLDRKIGRITQFSPIPQVADWVELGLRSLRWV